MFNHKWKYLVLMVPPFFGMLFGMCGMFGNIMENHKTAFAWSFLLSLNCFLATSYLALLFSTYEERKRNKSLLQPKRFFSKVGDAKPATEKRSIKSKVFLFLLWAIVFVVRMLKAPKAYPTKMTLPSIFALVRRSLSSVSICALFLGVSPD